MKKFILMFFAFHFSLFTLSAQSWLWARQGRNADKKGWLTGATSIAMDKYHNVYQTGKYDGDTVIFGSDTLFGKPFQTYLVKYDKNGNVLWAKSSQTNKNNANGFITSQCVITDSRNNAYITGQFSDTIYFQSFSLTSPQKNHCNAFLVKYDANGNVKWARQSITNRKRIGNIGWSIASDKSEKYIYMTGYYQDTASFGFDTLKGTDNPNAFLVKYDSIGNVIWVKQGINGVLGDAWGQSIITDNIGYVYITGYYHDSITFGTQTLTNPSEYLFNVFIAKFDSNGNVVWAKQPFLASSASGSYGDALGKDNSGNIYVTGYFYDTVSFGPYTLISPYYLAQAIFWAKCDNNGNLLWAKQAYNLDSLQWEGWSITTDDENNLYLTGAQDNAGTRKAKIIFGTDTMQSKVSDGSVWLKFDSNGAVLNRYIFPTGGGDPQTPVVVDSSGCYVYFGGTTRDTTIVFSKDTVGTNFYTFRPFVARWSDGKCTEGINTIESQNFSINLYPNPNNGAFTVEMKSEEPRTKNIIEVYNIFGEIIFNSNFVSTNIKIDLHNKSPGVYLYRMTNIQQGNLLASGKFIIQ